MKEPQQPSVIQQHGLPIKLQVEDPNEEDEGNDDLDPYYNPIVDGIEEQQDRDDFYEDLMDED